MSATFEDVKAVIMDVMKIDGDSISLDTRFVEDLKAEFHGSVLLDRWFL